MRVNSTKTDLDIGEITYHCDKCGEELEYSMEDDCLYCKICNEWQEPKCHDPECQFCTNRPEKPSDRLQK
jgi:exosome complex RNA-binding protein Csl4